MERDLQETDAMDQDQATMAAALAEALEQQAATGEILGVISSSPADIQPVFDAIARSAVHLCHGQFCAVFRLEDDLIHVVGLHGMSAEGERAYRLGFPLRVGPGSAIGRAIHSREVAHIPDVQADGHYRQLTIAQAVTFRAIVAVPMMRDGHPIGGIAVSSSQPGEFSSSKIALLKTFADQATIAVANVALFQAVEEHTRALDSANAGLVDSLAQHSATSEILRVIASSPTDAQPGFAAIARWAMELCAGMFGGAFEFDGERIHLMAHFGLGAEAGAAYERSFPSLPGRHSAVGRAIIDKCIAHIPDIDADSAYRLPGMAEMRFHSVLAVPMVRDGAVIGGIAVGRSIVGPFPEDRIKLLTTFADQGAIAIGNVRQFRELESRTRALTLSSDQLAQANAQVTALNAQLQSENLRMGVELDVTRRLQLMLLPGAEELRQVKGLDIAGHMQPAVEVGGDYFDVLQHGGRVKIGIGDVTGHGLESGVLMVMTQSIVRALLASGEDDPVRFLAILNHALFGNVQRMGGDKNLTLCLLDYADGEIKVSGQHEEMIVMRRGGAVERVDTIDLGFPIGLVDEISEFVGQTTVKLLPGDGFVLYTDGITEAENVDKVQYGLERLCSVVSQHWHLPAEQIKDAVVVDVAQYIGAQTVYDDITLVVVKQQ